MPGVLVLNAVAAMARASRRFRSERLLSEKQRNEDERSRKRRFDGRREATCAAEPSSLRASVAVFLCVRP